MMERAVPVTRDLFLHVLVVHPAGIGVVELLTEAVLPEPGAGEGQIGLAFSAAQRVR